MTFKKGLVSVIIPIYNVELYLRTCIESVINQTYPHLEIIIVDDGSTDRSGEICDEYQKKDERITIYHKKHGGTSRARNLGLQRATGEFIGFVDGDDFIDQDMYETMLREMKADSDIVTCGRYITYPAENHKKSQFLYMASKLTNVKGEKAVEELLKRRLFSFSVCDKLFRRQLLDDVLFPAGRTCEDIPVVYKLFTKSKGIVHIGCPKYHNFRRTGSSSRQEFYYRRIDYALFAGELCTDIRKRYPMLVMQAEALYMEYVVYTLSAIRLCSDRSKYRFLENRLEMVLWHMSVRILCNSCMRHEKKWEYLKNISDLPYCSR